MNCPVCGTGYQPRNEGVIDNVMRIQLYCPYETTGWHIALNVRMLPPTLSQVKAQISIAKKAARYR